MIDYVKVKKYYPTYEKVANAYPVVKKDWQIRFPLADSAEPEQTKGELSDFVKPVSWLKLRTRLYGKYANASIANPNRPWRYAGSPHYQWLNSTYASILAILLKNENVIMGDATGKRGGNHKFHEGMFYRFDMDYPNFGNKGTHYGCRKFGTAEIWKDTSYLMVDSTVLDRIKTRRIFNKIKGAFPDVVIRVSDPMKKALGLSWLLGDRNPVYNHWRHADFVLNFKVNWNYKI